MKILDQRITYRFQTFLYALQFAKVYHLLRVFVVFTKFTSMSNDNYIEHHGGESDAFYSLKCVQKENPFRLLIFDLSIVVITLGIILRMFEIINIQGNGFDDFYFYTNGMWTIIVAITTGKYLFCNFSWVR